VAVGSTPVVAVDLVAVGVVAVDLVVAWAAA